jgi:small conductance mechanosensitive channel
MNLPKAAAPAVDKLVSWVETAVKMLPNIVVAIFFLICFSLVAFVTGRLVHRMVLRLSPYHHVARLIARLSQLVVIAIGVLLALDALNLDRAVASMLAGIGVVGLAFGLAAKDVGGDYLAGMIIHFTHLFRTGHLVQAGNFMGYVESMELRATRISTQQGQSVTIPNHKMVGSELVNYTISGKRRVDLKCGIAYESDLQKAEDLAIKAVESLETRNPEFPVELFYEDFGESTINFTLRFWSAPEQKTYLTARSQAIKAIARTFADHGITMPYPTRTLDLSIVDFSKIGESLREQLQSEESRLSAPKETKRENDNP